WKQYRAFTGPAFLISVGYMDPGNWGTDLQAGASFRFDLLWVVAVSSFMAIIMQVTSARLGVVTGKDLAQACRDHLPAWTRWPNWIACELAIGACDFAEMGRALFSPGFRREGMIVGAIGIIGATVMPHNLYLHSALVQSRRLGADEPAIRRAIKFNTIDTVVALTLAFFVNAAILVLA